MNPREDRTSECEVMAEQPSRPSAAPSQDEPVIQAMHEYLAALEAGEQPDRAEFLDRHADIAEALADCLEGLELVHGLAPEMRPAGQRERTLEPAPTDLQPDVPLGDYRIVREIGRGGMGVVYEAIQLSLGRRVALKVLPFAAALDERQLQRFKNEAQAAAGLHHTNIVPVFGVGCERGVYYYAMQYIEGQTLAELIRELRRQAGRKGSEDQSAARTRQDATAAPATRPSTSTAALLSTERAPRSAAYFRIVTQLMAQAAEALEYAHQRGVVHRDVKPANLLVDHRNNVWITDFGLAHCQNQDGLTMTGDLIGTLRYMSPEQALGQRQWIDRRSDVYALGATLYELLTLQPPFAGSDRQELIQQVICAEPQPPRRLNRAVPAELEVIALKAMEKRAADRYATAREMADDLGRFLRHEPLRARRPTVLQRARKWARRHRPVVWSVAVVLLLALAFAGANVWLWSQKGVAAAGAAGEALREAARLQQQEKWPEALIAVRRAEALLAGVGVVPDLRQQIERMSRDLEMVRRLQEVRLQLATIKDGQAEWEAINAAYGEAFAWYGLELENLVLPAAAKQVRSHAIHIQLAAALDHLAFVRRNAEGPGWRYLLEISQTVDPDPGRGRIRSALWNRDPRVSEKLIAAALNDELSPTMAVLLSGITRGTAAAERMVGVLRKVRQRNPADFWINHELGLGLYRLQPPCLEEAIRYLTAAVALRPDSPGARNNLGVALMAKGLVDEAIAEYREALRLQRDYASAHNNLGFALEIKGQVDEAIAEYREALRLQRDFVEAHMNLGHSLKARGQVSEANKEFQAAFHLIERDRLANKNIVVPLAAMGRMDEPIWFHEVDWRDFPLLRQEQATETFTTVERHHDLVSQKPSRQHRPRPTWFHRAQRLVELEDLLSRVLQGQASPADPDCCFALAWLCHSHKKRYVAAVRFYEEAFTALPKLHDNLLWGLRYYAARAAALAAAGQGYDAAGYNDPERERLRQKAFDWLRANLTHCTKQFKDLPPSSRTDLEQTLRRWKRVPDLASVRDEAALARLPEAERRAWRTFWADVEDVLADI